MHRCVELFFLVVSINCEDGKQKTKHHFVLHNFRQLLHLPVLTLPSCCGISYNNMFSSASCWDSFVRINRLYLYLKLKVVAPCVFCFVPFGVLADIFLRMFVEIIYIADNFSLALSARIVYVCLMTDVQIFF